MTPVAIEGAKPKIIVTISEQFGMYTVEYDNGGTVGRAQGSTLESALFKAAGENAPENYVLHTSSILGGIMAKAKGA